MEKNKHMIASIILAVVIVLTLILINVERSDMLNTQKILVVEGETGNLYEIDDKRLIRKIVKDVIREEKSGLDIDIDEPYAYSLEFFTPEQGYGPLLCFKGLEICIFEKETAGNYIKVDESFFKLIEEGIDR